MLIKSRDQNIFLTFKIKAMLGVLGGGENMSENLSGCLFSLEISLHKEMVGGGRTGGIDRTYLSQRREASSQ